MLITHKPASILRRLSDYINPFCAIRMIKIFMIFSLFTNLLKFIFECDEIRKNTVHSFKLKFTEKSMPFQVKAWVVKL